MTGSVTSPRSEVFLEARLSEPQVLVFPRHEVVVYSHASPERTTPSEDAAACLDLGDGTSVLLVADGVGGHNSGEVAAARTVGCVCEGLVGAPTEGLRSRILDCIEEANRQVLGLGIGAATTLSLVQLQGNRIRPYHVGDSTITLISQRGRIKWQSIGHAPVDFAVEAGVLDEEEGMCHPDRNVVWNVVGDEEMSISLGPALTMATRDTLIVCSDGLSDNVSTLEVADTLRRGSLETGCRMLVELAQQRMATADERNDLPGKPDDLTLIACRLRSETAPRRAKPVAQTVCQDPTDNVTDEGQETPPVAVPKAGAAAAEPSDSSEN